MVSGSSMNFCFTSYMKLVVVQADPVLVDHHEYIFHVMNSYAPEQSFDMVVLHTRCALNASIAAQTDILCIIMQSRQFNVICFVW